MNKLQIDLFERRQERGGEMKRIPQDVGRGRRLVLILAFLLPCVLLFQFLRQFTIGAGTMPYLM